MPRSFASPMGYLALMQEAARACPASAPCPDRDARTRVCAGAENRTRKRFCATITTLSLLVGRCAASHGSAGLASCYLLSARCDELAAGNFKRVRDQASTWPYRTTHG